MTVSTTTTTTTTITMSMNAQKATREFQARGIQKWIANGADRQGQMQSRLPSMSPLCFESPSSSLSSSSLHWLSSLTLRLPASRAFNLHRALKGLVRPVVSLRELEGSQRSAATVGYLSLNASAKFSAIPMGTHEQALCETRASWLSNEAHDNCDNANNNTHTALMSAK